MSEEVMDMEMGVEEEVSPASESEEYSEGMGEDVEVSPTSEEEGESPEADNSHEVEGLRSAIEAERQRRQQAEYYAQQLQAQYQQQQQQLQQQQQPQYDDDDIVTFGQAKQLFEQAQKQAMVHSQQQYVQMSEKMAKINHNDYDEVFQYTQELTNQNPALVGYIMNSVDPAETAYQLGKTHPNFSTKLKAQLSKDIASKIKKNSQQPQTLTAAGSSGSPMNSKNRFENMSEEELDAEYNRIMGL